MAVRLAPALGSGGFASDYTAGVADFNRLRAERLAKAQHSMKKNGLAAVLLMKTANIRYMTGVRILDLGESTNYCLAFAEHAPILFPHKGKPLGDCPWMTPEQVKCPIQWASQSPGRDASSEAAKRFAALIKGELRQRGLQGEELGIDSIDETGRLALAEANMRLVSAMPVMLEARAVKTDDEINLMRMAAVNADAAHYAIYEALKPGVRERDLVAVAYDSLLRAGTEPQYPAIYIRSGGMAGSSAFSSDRIIQPGDVVTVDVYQCNYMGYHTCYYRNYIVGRRPTDREKDLHNQCYERIYKAMESIKPGLTTADTAKHWEPAKEKGYPSEEWVWCEDLAHGLGLSLYEYPVSNRLWSFDHPQIYEKGMTMAVEAAAFDPLLGRLKLEEEVVVTADGVEILTRMPVKEIIVASLITTAE